MIGRIRTTAPKGQALVELALVLPLFFIVVFGIIDGGRMVYSRNALSQAAREGARWGSVQGRAVDAAGRAGIETETISRIIAVPDAQATVTCERSGATVSSCRSGDILVVRVEAVVSPVTPVLGALMGNPTLTAESRMVVNQ
jgi:Flp pilus assembly protein TadG